MSNYSPINETLARRAKEMMSFSDYQEGSATAAYRQMVDEAAELAQRQKKRVDPMYHEKIDRLLEVYSRKLAENLNQHYSIMTRCPSILIAGGGNFPVRKKEKQNVADDRNMEEFQRIQGILDKIRHTGTGGISSDDPSAVEKLKRKLEALKKQQEHMKAVNAYYRKHKTLEGCPGLSEEAAQAIQSSWDGGWYPGRPYPPYALSNNNANIRRIQARIAELEAKREAPAPEGWVFDGGQVAANTEENRLQILFEDKPDAELRSELKRQGFRWAPSQGVWQRQLTDNAIYAAKQIPALAPEEGQIPIQANHFEKS